MYVQVIVNVRSRDLNVREGSKKDVTVPDSTLKKYFLLF